MAKKIKIEYIAGFFDGEGCITFSRVMKYNPMMKRRYPCTTIRMEATNTDFKIIKDVFGFFNTGHLITIKPRKKGYKKQLRWQLTHRQAQKVIKRLLPYMREKNKIKQAKKVLKYYKERDAA
jgi:hypothetical protein|tara:strand:+ start:734 stop:1099 length:366 start_codon:yes stop_codon:yes gene_type:complete